ncbi:helix-turn-helix transcriptional regulator [Actinomadura keratinilytica]|uniref:helix-turn-helix transcriptional regulator n=1 Tax=Actinomadura keratinilytica TaxID=547461 RepID=UPI00360F09AE
MILEERGDRLEYARALEDLGRARRDLGDESAGRGLSRRARRLMHEIGGAAADGAAGAPAGAMPVPRDGARNPAGLSDAELRVAALAARGHTNRQIAARLYITTSTVEQHLTRVYRKLDVRRRSELPARLDSAAGVP